MPLSLNTHNAWRNPTLPITRRELHPLLHHILDHLNLQDMELEVTLLRDGEMEELNRSSRKCPGPTNVLSFPMDDDPGEKRSGLIALSIDSLSREIVLYGQDPLQHLLRLLCHAILHLAGFEHGPDMEEATAAVLQSAPSF